MTLVQEFKGRKDHADYIKRGIKVDNELKRNGSYNSHKDFKRILFYS